MRLRAERAADATAIRDLTEAAFAGAAHASGTESRIVEALRTAGALSLSLVAEAGGAVVGHVAFSPMTIEAGPEGWVGLGPISVAPARQGAGIGAALMREGLRRMREAGAAGCVVLGDPGYYTRFGFARTGLRLEGVSQDYFLALGFGGAVPAGTVRYPPAFDA